MNRTAQSLAWAGIGLVALGMAIAFVAVVAGRSGGDASQGARVQITAPGDGRVMTSTVPPDGTAAPGSTGSPDTARPTSPTDLEPSATDGSSANDPARTTDPGATEQAAGNTTEQAEPTLTTAAAGTLGDKLVSTAAAAGFVVFSLDQPGWRITALDAGGSGGSAYLTLAYENGEDYINLSQSPSGTRPSLAEAETVSLRGLSGELAEMRPVLLLRWDEEGTGLLFSTDLSRERALALAERLRPLR